MEFKQQQSRVNKQFDSRRDNTNGGWPSVNIVEADQNRLIPMIIPDAAPVEAEAVENSDSPAVCNSHTAESRQQLVKQLFNSPIIGSSKDLQICLETVFRAAPCDANILIVGETGTGKELFARALHNASLRRQGPMVVVDCTALPKNLVGSLLFGHSKGSFTGANQVQEGVIRQAHSGTLFLDEVGELPVSLQKVFLRVLDERRFRPIGSDQEVDSDFRLVAATNRNLETMVEQGLFRADLLFRLKSFLIELPPLRKRDEDVKELALYHLGRLCARYRIAPKRLAADFLSMLNRYDWPGNVRELVHALEHALFAAKYESILFAKHLPNQIRTQVMKSSLSNHAISRPDLSESFLRELPSLHEFREDIFCQAETQYLQDLMVLSKKDIHAACQLSGLSRSRLYALLKKHAISRLQ